MQRTSQGHSGKERSKDTWKRSIKKCGQQVLSLATLAIEVVAAEQKTDFMDGERW